MIDRFVTEDTDIVIEGFPRTANTFAVAAFIVAQQKPVRIAHHTHKAIQVIRAVQLGKPTIVVIRKPIDAVASLTIRQPAFSLSQGLRVYSRFYKAISPHRSGYIVAEFTEVTNDFGKVVERVNRQFGTVFQTYLHNEESLARTFELISEMHLDNTGESAINERAIARPSMDRNALKVSLRAEFEDEPLKSKLRIANDIYAEMVQK